MDVVRAALLGVVGLGVAACSGKTRAVDAGSAAVSVGSDAAVGSDAPPIDGPPTTGDVQVRVEWKNVPVAARASSGLTACNNPRSASVAPTTTWGIPEVLVFVEGVSSAGASARIALVECALWPRIAVGSSLTVASGADRPTEVMVAPRGTVEGVLGGALDKAVPTPVRLPIMGHTVALELDPDAIYELTTADKEPESAWLAPRGAGVTDPSGVALIQSVAPGAHAVVAWLPPRGGQKARVARGTVTVETGELAELTLQLE